MRYWFIPLFSVICFATASRGYFLLRLVMPYEWVFGALYRMFAYHWEYPFQYIALISLVYGIVATSMGIAFRHRKRVSLWGIISVMLSTILLASPLGGVLWVIHDMQAGYFTKGSRFWGGLAWGAWEGVKFGWLIILLSIPYNILGLISGFYVTKRGFSLVRLPTSVGV